jgi:hypothetical protein
MSHWGSQDWTQHEVAFGVWDQGQWRGLLRIIPLGCEISEGKEIDLERNSCYGIYVQVRIEAEEFLCTMGDFIHPNCFRELLEMLKSNDKRTVGTVDIQGDDGNVEIRFNWMEDGGVAVAGQMPSKNYPWENRLVQDPQLPRQFILTTVQFEFVVDQKYAVETCAEIENLLDYIRALEEAYSG